MKRKISDLIMGWIIEVALFVIFAPLILIFFLLLFSAYIPKIENTFVFNIVIWVDNLAKGFKPPWTPKKKLNFVLTYFTSVALWIIILYVIF